MTIILPNVVMCRVRSGRLHESARVSRAEHLVKGPAAACTTSNCTTALLKRFGVGLQARQLMRGLCYRTIAEVRRRQQARQQARQQQQQQHQGAQSPPVNGVASPAFSSDDDAVSQAEAGSTGGRKQRSKGTLPFGGFIGHLLESDNPIISNREFTDLEVGLPHDCSESRPSR
jgi:hypothetical protein